MCGKYLEQCLVPTGLAGKASSFPEEGRVITKPMDFHISWGRDIEVSGVGLSVVETLIESLKNIMQEKKGRKNSSFRAKSLNPKFLSSSRSDLKQGIYS